MPDPEVVDAYADDAAAAAAAYAYAYADAEREWQGRRILEVLGE